MLKRPLVLSLAATVTGASIFFSVRSHGQGTALPVNPPVTHQSGSLPEHVPYMFLFDQHGSNLRKAAELELQGKDSTFFRTMFKNQLGLSDDESAVFDGVTQACEQELTQQDVKAQAVISKFKAQYPGGVVPPGQTLLPPPELTTLQQERNAIILKARDRLRAAFGEGEFTRFDSYIMGRFASRVQVN